MGKSQRKTAKPKMAKSIMYFAIAGFTIALIGGIYFFNAFQKYRKDIEAIQIYNIDLAAIEDGEYFGESDAGLVGASVKVVVENHNIIAIELLAHKNGRGAAAEVIPEEIVKKQRIDVDTISGATSSSKVIQEAVYNALR